MRLLNWLAMAGLIGGVLALPARAQDCYIPATGDAYLWADGQGDVYGYSITYNTCQDPSVDVQVYAELDDAGWYALDSGTDIEYNGNDAEVDTAATVFYAGNYYQYGVHEYYECGYSGWEPANPEYTEYETWSPAPNQVPTVSYTYPDDSGSDPTWTPGGGPYSGAYEVEFEGADLTGEIPTVTDTGCPAAYSVSAWQTADSAVWTTVTVSSSLTSACYLNFALLGWPVGVLLAPPASPVPSYLKVVSDNTSNNNGYPLRTTVYQVMLNNGLPATTSLELCESPTNVTWSCSQKNPGLQASYCPGGAYAQNPALTSGAGQLTDRWSLFSSAYSPAGCGVNDTDPWYYMQSGTNTSYLGTLTGYVHTDAVSINGVACTGSEQTGCGMATGTVIH